jgi:hypothetical protein
LLFAAADGQVAENLTAEGTGLYFKELMPVFAEELTWPPDMPSVVTKLERRFAELREKNLTSQVPIYQYWRAPSGKTESKYLGAGPAPQSLAKKWAVLAAACILPSLLLSELGLGLSPPWPNRWVVALATIPVPYLVYRGVAHWASSQTRSRLERSLRWNLAACLLAIVFYLFLFVQFTHPLPDHWHREIGGFTYSEKASWYREINPGIPVRDLIQDMGNDVEKVFGRVSLGLTRTALLACWLTVFVLGSSLVSLYLLCGRRGVTGAEPQSAT